MIGDLSAATDLAAATSRVDAVVHVAGITKARTREEYREGNARGTARLVDAARPDLSGRAVFLADPVPRTIGELSALIASLPTKRPRLVPIPRAAVRMAGAVETVVEGLTRRSRPFNADKAREILAGDWICDGTPLARDLRLPEAPPLREDLAATWGWYVREGWLSL